jgi:hypothetical protein
MSGVETPQRRASPALPLRDLMREALQAAGASRGGNVAAAYVRLVCERLGIGEAERRALLPAIGGLAHVERALLPLLDDVRREIRAAQGVGAFRAAVLGPYRRRDEI